MFSEKEINKYYNNIENLKLINNDDFINKTLFLLEKINKSQNILNKIRTIINNLVLLNNNNYIDKSQNILNNMKISLNKERITKLEPPYVNKCENNNCKKINNINFATIKYNNKFYCIFCYTDNIIN